MKKSSPYFALCLVLGSSVTALGSAVVGLGKQVVAGRVNPVIYFLVGIPIGMVLVFRLEMYESGFWIGLASS